MITLAPYQQEAVEAVVSEWMGGDGVMRQIVQMPPGAGKTHVSAAVARWFMGPSGPFADGRFLFLVHNAEIVRKSFETYAAMLPEMASQMGVVQAEKDEHAKRFVFASWQTLNRPERLRRYLSHGKPSLIVTDEAHHVPSRTYLDTLLAVSEGADRWGRPKPTALTVGITATPNRSDGYSLAMYFEKIVYSISLLEMIAMGYLCDIRRVQVVTDIDLEKCRVSASGEYNAEDLERAVARSKDRYDKVYEALMRHAPDKQFGCIAANVPDAYAFAKYLNDKGLPTTCITARTKGDEREATLESYRRGELRGVCGYGTLVEGIDLPTMEVMIWLRHTQSVNVYVQGSGRCGRVLPEERDLPVEQRTKQSCLIIEAAGNDHRMATMAVMVGKTEREVGNKSVKQMIEAGELDVPDQPAFREPPGGRGTYFRNAPIFHEYQWTGIGGRSYELRVPGHGKFQAIWDLTGYQVVHTTEGGKVSHLSRVPLPRPEHAFGRAEEHLKMLRAKEETAEQRRSDPAVASQPVPYAAYRWMKKGNRWLHPVPKDGADWTVGEYQRAMDDLKACKRLGISWYGSRFHDEWRERQFR